jgi:hypothetical protein
MAPHDLVAVVANNGRVGGRSPCGARDRDGKKRREHFRGAALMRGQSNALLCTAVNASRARLQQLQPLAKRRV